MGFHYLLLSLGIWYPRNWRLWRGDSGGGSRVVVAGVYVLEQVSNALGVSVNLYIACSSGQLERGQRVMEKGAVRGILDVAGVCGDETDGG